MQKMKLSDHRTLYYEPNYHYCNKVLNGSKWYEERLKYIPKRYKHNTVYSTVYTKPEVTFEKNDTFWTNKIKSQDGKVRKLLDDKIKENFVTCYNISYNILPKTKSTAPRRYSTAFNTYLPQQDFNKQCGNNMQYGVKERLCNKIKYEALCSPWDSETYFSYPKPELNSYTIKRIAVPRKFSSSLCNANLQNVNLPFRNSQLSIVPDIVPDFKPRNYPHFYF